MSIDPNMSYKDFAKGVAQVLIDEYGESDEPSKNHREYFFDIETEILQGFPNSKNPINKITSIAYWKKDLNEYGVYILDPDKAVESKVKDNVHIISCETEYELLQLFLEDYRNYEPTILTGWNIEIYEIPNLYNRICRVMGQEFGQAMSRINIVKEREIRQFGYNDRQESRYDIFGVEILDYLALYRKFSIGERSSYRLDAVAGRA